MIWLSPWSYSRSAARSRHSGRAFRSCAPWSSHRTHNPRSYPSPSIDWQVSFGDDYFVSAGSSDNPLYVTRNRPVVSIYPLYESVYSISCTAADGQSTPGGVSDAIWGAFSSPPNALLKRKERDGFNQADGQTLRYWQSDPLNPPPVGLKGMLMHPAGWGQCTGFAQLLKACWEIHGLAASELFYITNPAAGSSTGFLVKNWDATGPPPLFIGSNLLDADGVRGQGDPGYTNPWSRFRNHYVVVSGLLRYDPSYGSTPKLTWIDYENVAIDALYTSNPLDGSPATLQDPLKQDLQFEATAF